MVEAIYCKLAFIPSVEFDEAEAAGDLGMLVKAHIKILDLTAQREERKDLALLRLVVEITNIQCRGILKTPLVILAAQAAFEVVIR